MIISRRGDTLRIVRITGPTHNLLGLQFGQDPKPAPQVEVLPSVGPVKTLPPWDVDAVRASVIEGVRAADEETGTTHAVSRIEIVEDDSGPPEVYRHLAKELVLRLVKGDFDRLP